MKQHRTPATRTSDTGGNGPSDEMCVAPPAAEMSSVASSTPVLDAVAASEPEGSLMSVPEEQGPFMSLSDEQGPGVCMPEQDGVLMSLEEEGPGVCEPAEQGALLSLPAEPGMSLIESETPLESLSDEAAMEEQVGVAEQARDQLEDRLTALSEVPADERAVLMARVQGLDGAALVREMEMIEHALGSGNSGRAMHALAGITTIVSGTEGAGERVTPEITEMLVRGVADSRSESDRGQEGVMGARRAREATTALIGMSDESYASTTDLLSTAGQSEEDVAIEGADRSAEQSLILKAVAHRQEALTADATAGGAMTDLTDFAGAIHGMQRDDLIDQTTALDVNDANTSTVDPSNIAAGNDTTTDNDGLYQRFEDSCGPTSGQLLHAEQDPIYALALHQDPAGFTGADPTSALATEQSTILNAGGGQAVSRIGTQARGNLTTSMDAMEVTGLLTAGQRGAVAKQLSGAALTPAEQTAADAGLAAIRAQNGGHPDAMEVAAMLADNGTVGAGMSIGGAQRAAATNGTNYTTNGTGGNPSAADLLTIEQSLLDGEDVGIRIGYTAGGGHGLMISDVRTDDSGVKTFLISDPWTGATRWATSADLTSGAFANNQFSLGAAQTTHYNTED